MSRWSNWSLDGFIAAVCCSACYFMPDIAAQGAVATAAFGWVSYRHRWWRQLSRGLLSEQPGEFNEPRCVPSEQAHRRSSPLPADLSPFVQQMLAQGRTALLLRPQIAESLTPLELSAARTALDEMMAMVPDGEVIIIPRGLEGGELGSDASEVQVPVDAFLLDRYLVTNRDFHAFVADGGYHQTNLWEPAIWPAVLQFVDRSGHPGPADWHEGEVPSGKEHHPVVGISWFEAVAYARWAGKRLPTDAEWVKAAAWPICEAGTRPRQQRYPWGDAMDHRLTNIWGGPGKTSAVGQYAEGGAVNGVYDLIGNVWEWTASVFDEYAPPRLRWDTSTPLRSIRGGAFDTYFDTQAATSFASGSDPFARTHNIGFRCAITLSELPALQGEESVLAGRDEP